MIIKLILELLYTLITAVFGLLPSIPSLDGLTGSIDRVMGVIFDNLQLLGCFVRPGTIIAIVPVFLVIYNFEYIYKVTMWILKKIPMLGMQ